MKDPELLEQYERDLEMLTRVSHALPGALREAAELSYPLRAASYDTEYVTGGRSVIWCWTHQREVHRCQRHELECTGEPVTVSDPTGEAAVTPGRVSLARQEIESDLQAIHARVERLVFNAAYLTRTPESHREARQREDERKDLAGENDARCFSCARVERAPGVAWDCGATPGRSGNLRRTDCDGVLDEPRPLCKWTRNYVATYGQLPTTEEVEQRRDRGDNIRKTA